MFTRQLNQVSLGYFLVQVTNVALEVLQQFVRETVFSLLEQK